MALWYWCQQTLCCHRHQHISHTTMYSAQHPTAMRTDRHTVTVTLEETTPACAVKQTKNQHVLISTADWNQDLVHASHILYHWDIYPAPLWHTSSCIRHLIHQVPWCRYPYHPCFQIWGSSCNLQIPVSEFVHLHLATFLTQWWWPSSKLFSFSHAPPFASLNH